MVSFAVFLTEGSQTFHRQIGIPQSLQTGLNGRRLSYSSHAQEEARKDNVKLPTRLPTEAVLVEVETVNGVAVKYLYRYRYDAQQDLVLAITTDGHVKTVWVNQAKDLHRTLDTRKYARPEWFRTPKT